MLPVAQRPAPALAVFDCHLDWSVKPLLQRRQVNIHIHRPAGHYQIAAQWTVCREPKASISGRPLRAIADVFVGEGAVSEFEGSAFCEDAGGNEVEVYR